MTTKIFQLLFCLLLLASCRTPAPDAHFAFTRSDVKPGFRIEGGKLAILPFDCSVPATGVEVSDVVTAHLRVGCPLTIIDQPQLQAILRDKGLSADGIARGREYSKIGQLSSDIDYLMIGQVSALGGRRSIITGATAKLIEVRTGEMLMTATYSTPKKGWGTAKYVGESLAAAIKKEMSKGMPKAEGRTDHARVTLRAKPKKLTDGTVKEIILQYGFFERGLNPSSSFQNDLVDNGDGTVTDGVTGLMWEKAGSPRSTDFDGSGRYVTRLNRGGFAGYSDWRLPTVEELCSLLTGRTDEHRHISTLLNFEQKRCWSSDWGDEDTARKEVYIVDFLDGRVTKTFVVSSYSSQSPFATNHVRAVRSVR